MPNQWKGLGVGSYFGSIGAAKVLFGVVFPSGLAQMAPTIGVIWASITCLSAAMPLGGHLRRREFPFPPTPGFRIGQVNTAFTELIPSQFKVPLPFWSRDLG